MLSIPHSWFRFLEEDIPTISLKWNQVKACEGATPHSDYFLEFLRWIHPANIQIVFISDVASEEGVCWSRPIHMGPSKAVRNIHQTLQKFDPQFKIPNHGSLRNWRAQRIFFLPVAWAHAPDKKEEHFRLWYPLARSLLEKLQTKLVPRVFVFCGKWAQSLCSVIDNPIHMVIRTPSPTQEEFLDEWRIYGEINSFLTRKYDRVVYWNVLRDRA